MNRRITLTLGAAAGGLVASAVLPVALAFADTTSVFPDVPGSDAFTIGTTTFDPFTGSAADPTEGFAALTQGTGVPNFFETGSTATQDFELYSDTAATTSGGSTTYTDLGTAASTENVSSLGSITDTGFTITGVTPDASLTTAQTADLPVDGTVYNVANFGSGYENVFTDVPSATAGDAGTVADTLVTPFGNYDLSSLVSAFDLTALDPGAAFGLAADTTGSAAADAVGSIDPLSFLGL
jgi:hypothetical protein